MKARSTICFLLSFISLIISLVIFAKGFLIAGLILLFFGLITSYVYQSRFTKEKT